MSGPLLNVIHCERTRKVMRAALDAGWEWIGMTKGGHVEIRWPAKDALIHCATTPSDPNSWKQFARQVEQVSGITVWRKGNRRRSRKSMRDPNAAELAAARRKYLRRIEQEREASRQQAAREAQRRARAEAALASERHRREIEDLMRPGYGR